jgi:hypothetical protein
MLDCGYMKFHIFILLVSFYIFNVTSREFKVTHVAHIIFLLVRAGLETPVTALPCNSSKYMLNGILQMYHQPQHIKN